jgi:hypothetical protein
MSRFIHFIAILSACSLATHAAPPKELAPLQQQYSFLLVERVTNPYDTGLAALNTKFTAALEAAIAQAKSAGDLPAVLAIQADKKLLAENQPLPADDDKTPDPLKKLRMIYRDQLAKLTEQKTANATTLLAPYAAKLKELEATLTKADRIAEAQEVLTYREGLKADAPLEVPAVAVPTTPAPRTSEDSAPAKPARIFPPGDDRKAAEWALDYAYQFKIKVTGEERERYITSNTPLPGAPFVITTMAMNHQTPPKKPLKTLEPLAGLQHLRWLILQNMEINDADCDIFASLPKIEILDFNKSRGKLTGARFDLLASSATFRNLDLRGCQVTTNGIKALAALKNLESLSLTNTETSDKDLSHLASMTSLQSLKLDLTKVTSKGFAALKPLVNLTGFGWSPTPRKAKAELAELAAILPDIVSFQLRSLGNLSTEDVAGLSAFPKLEKMYLEFETCSKEILAGLSTLPALKHVRCYFGMTTTDDAFASLAQSSTLEVVEFENMPKLTGAVLAHLGKIPNLQKIALSRCDKIDQASIDAFKKAHPQVSINK